MKKTTDEILYEKIVLDCLEIFTVLNDEIAVCSVNPNITLQQLSDLIEKIKINAKYMEFDLAATRRELSIYKKLLEDDNGDG
jgi:hypothetical protein